MMNYDKIYERVVRRGDEILKQRSKKAVKIKQTSYVISGLCATAIVGVGIWRISSSHKLNNNDFSNNNIIDDNDNTTTNQTTTQTTDIVTTKPTTSVPSTTSMLKTTTKNTTVTSINTSTFSNETSALTINTTVSTKLPIPTTQNTHSTTSYIKTYISEIAEAPYVTTSSTIDIGTNTSISSSYVTTSIVTTTTTAINIQDNFRSFPCFFRFNNNRYEKESSISENNSISDYIRKVSVNITLPYDCVIVDYMEAYGLHNINIEEAIAVKLKDTDEYYLFRNIDYFNDKK